MTARAYKRLPHRRAASGLLKLYASSRCWPGDTCTPPPRHNDRQKRHVEATVGDARALAAISREAQRLFVSPADRALARLRRMCDIRFAALNPPAAKSSRPRCDQTFSFSFSLSFALL
jgi:hypothetical protein